MWIVTWKYPNPSRGRGRTSLQTAAVSGLDIQARDLLARGASMKARRRDETPYRLAMRRGHIPVLRSLRDAGARRPPGSRPPANLPDAVVLRLYAQAFVWWIAGGVAAVCVAIAIVGQVWPLLVVAPMVILVVLIRNWTMGWFRLAVDGPLICVRHLYRWHGPIDLRQLSALGYVATRNPRWGGRWRLAQRRHDLRVMSLPSWYSNFSPGFDAHLAQYVVGTDATISTLMRQRIDHLECPR